MAKAAPQDVATERKKAELVARHRELVGSWHDAQDVFTRLCRRLHQSLNLDRCLDIFVEELRSVMAFNSLCYQNHRGPANYSYTEGHGGHHRCHYNLTLEGMDLGSITLHRRSRFAEEELIVLEQLIGILVLPLRNCWLYRQAQQQR